jgi:hypothetical protein
LKRFKNSFLEKLRNLNYTESKEFIKIIKPYLRWQEPINQQQFSLMRLIPLSKAEILKENTRQVDDLKQSFLFSWMEFEALRTNEYLFFVPLTVLKNLTYLFSEDLRNEFLLVR